MNPLLRLRAALCLPIVAMFLVATAPPAQTAAAQKASLDVSPRVYVGGQRLTFDGNIGKAGKRRVHVQTHMARPGDSWVDLEGSGAMTDANGNFKFNQRAPSMFGIKLRVVSGGTATPAFVSDARSQDLTLRAISGVPGMEDNQVLVEVPFEIRVDTTPTITRRPDLPPPAFPGRELTLQQRVNGNEWDTLDTTTTNQNGVGSFDVSALETGNVVYRVRQENYTDGGNEIGWFPSFPTYVRVLPDVGPPGGGVAGRASASQGDTSTRTASRGPALGPTAVGRRTPTASGTYGWGRAIFDFAWEFGESLTSRPYRGSDPVGRWVDASNGSGRVAKHNGGLILDSQRNYDGPGDHGTTSATLRDNAMKYGRWETKFRLKSPEKNARDYRVRVELVPENTSDNACGARNITVADVAAHSRRVIVGAKSAQANKQWTYNKKIGSLLDGGTAAFGVEVSKSHISWFVNGRVIATLKNKKAVSDVPMTMRLSLVGDGQKEMNATQAIFDWQRGYSASPGRTATSGHKLKGSGYSGGC